MDSSSLGARRRLDGMPRSRGVSPCTTPQWCSCGRCCWSDASTLQTASRSVQPFLHSSQLCTTQRDINIQTDDGTYDISSNRSHRYSVFRWCVFVRHSAVSGAPQKVQTCGVLVRVEVLKHIYLAISKISRGEAACPPADGSWTRAYPAAT